MKSVDICQLFYVSRASAPCNDADIQSILRSSRRHNERLDITGCLLFSGCCFAQMLEGRDEVVRALVARLADDRRHACVKVLVQRHRSSRDYAHWSMGFVHDLTLEDALVELCDGTASTASMARVLVRMQPDPVMGSLR